jgi:hypothetical protein
MDVMKDLAALQALAGAQAYRMHLRAKCTDRNIGTRKGQSVKETHSFLKRCLHTGVGGENSNNVNNPSYLTESGGTTSEAVIMSRGGTAASQLQTELKVKVNTRGSSMTKKSEIRKEIS